MTKYEAKSVVFGRMPRKEGDEFKTAFFKIYEESDPLTEEVITGFPKHEVIINNIEKIEMNTPPEYYLEGNDLVYKNIKSIEIEKIDNNLKITIER